MVVDTVLKMSIQKEASNSVENSESDSCTQVEQTSCVLKKKQVFDPTAAPLIN